MRLSVLLDQCYGRATPRSGESRAYWARLTDDGSEAKLGWLRSHQATASVLCVTCVLFRCFRDFSLWAVEAAATHDIMPIMLHLLFGSFFEDFYYKSWWIMTRTTLPATTEWHIKKCVLFGNYKWILSCDNGNTFRCFLWCTIRRNTQKRENSIKLLQNNGLSSAQTFSQNIYLEIVLHACIKPRNWK